MAVPVLVAVVRAAGQSRRGTSGRPGRGTEGVVVGGGGADDDHHNSRTNSDRHTLLHPNQLRGLGKDGREVGGVSLVGLVGVSLVGTLGVGLSVLGVSRISVFPTITLVLAIRAPRAPFGSGISPPTTVTG